MLKKLSRIRSVAIVLLAVALLFSVTFSASVAADPATSAKNIILMISDGGGFNHVLAADYYQYGAAGTQVYEDFPVQVACSTFEYERADNPFPYPYVPPYPSENPAYVMYGYDPVLAWSDFDYLPWMIQGSSSRNAHTDSASAITALVTGIKTKDGYLGVDINKNPVTNIVEILETTGRATGVVSSAPFSHATPAGCEVHHDNRNDYFTIADMMLYDSALDVIVSTGAPDFDQDGNPVDPYTYEHQTSYISLDTWADIADGSVMGADADGDGIPDEWTVIRTLTEFQNMATGTTPDRVLGIPQVHETMQMKRAGNGSADAYVVPLTPDLPNLADMSKAALNVLDNDPDGFFVMIEGAAVDWASHERWPGRTIEEQIDFNLAVDAVVDWVEANSNWDETLVIVTADHETGYIWGPGSGPGEPPTWNPVINNGAGNMPGFEFYSELWHPAFPYAIGWHTNSLVPIYAKGPCADLFNTYAVNTDPVYGEYLDNIDMFKVMTECMGMEVVSIDIKPGSDLNSINLKSKGVVPVAILTTEDFDTSTVDPSTVVFASATPVRWTMEDVDTDGDLDMLFFFKTQELELSDGNTKAFLVGATTDGTPILGEDTVNTVPKGK
jgi:alkaline phosphatase